MIDPNRIPQLSQLEQCVLVRLLAGGKPPTRSDLDKALKRYFAERVAMPASQWRETLDGAINSLRGEQFVETGALRLTEDGRHVAVHVLGVDSVPAGSKWMTLRNRYLMALALGIQPRSKTEWERLGTADGLRAAVLAKHYQLSISPVPTPARALHALAWLQLQEAHEVPLPLDKDFTRNAVLRLTLLDGQSGRKPEEVLAARAVGAVSTHPDRIREAVICKWVAGESSQHVDRASKPPLREQTSEPPPAEAELEPPFDLRTFATQVNNLARHSTSGRFGEHKVFIAHVWNRFRQLPAGATMSRQTFDQHLLEANRADLLTLSRADLVSGMDPNDVRQSEIRTTYSTVHFIRTDC